MLIELIRGLNKEELRHIKIFLNRTNAADSRKDVQLLDLIRNSKRIDEERFFRKLYPKGEKNAYYRLKNRLTEEVLKSLSTLYYSESASVQALHVLGIARHFGESGKTTQALDLLARAETLASKDQDHGLVELILTEFLRLAITHPHNQYTPESIITRRLLNREKILLEQEVDDILSVISSRMRQTKDHEVRNALLNSLRNELDTLLFGPRLSQMDVLRVRLYKAYHRILTLYSDKKQLEKFIRQCYKSFKKEDVFDRSRRNMQADMLIELISLMNQHGKEEKTIKYLDDLHDLARISTGERRRALLSEFYTLSHRTYMGINPFKASDLMKEALSEKALRHDFELKLQFSVPLIKSSHTSGKLQELRDKLVEMRNDRSFTDLDEIARIKVETSDLLVRWHFEETDYIRHFIDEPLRISSEWEELAKQRILLEVLQAKIDGTKAHFDLDTWTSVSSIPDFPTGDLLDYDRWLLEVR